MGFLDRLFGKRAPQPPEDNGIYFYVRCNNCQRVVHTRLNPQADLSETEEGGFEVRKGLLDDRCFRPITLRATFDAKRNMTDAQVEGGTLIDRATWEVERDLPRRPTTE